MQQFFVKRCEAGEGREYLRSVVKNQAQTTSEEYSSALSGIGVLRRKTNVPLPHYKLETSRGQQSLPYRRSVYLSYNLLLAFILSSTWVYIDALLATSKNCYTMRSVITSTSSRCSRVPRHIPELNSWQDPQPSGNEHRSSSTRLFSQIPRYLDQLAPSNTALSNTAPIAPMHNASFRTSSHNDATTTTLVKESHIADIISKTSRSLLHHSTLRNTNNDATVEIPSSATTTTTCLENVFSYDLPEGKCVGLRLNNSHNHSSSNKDSPTSLDPKQIESNEHHWIKKPLHADEVQYGIDLPTEHARMTFYVGRLAMRTALSLAYEEGKTSDAGMIRSIFSTKHQQQQQQQQHTPELLPYVSRLDPSILKDQYGRPQIPTGFIGSISHKKNMGVALVSSVDDDCSLPPTKGVGVDIEQTFSRRKDIAKKVLTEWEIENLGKIEGVTRDEEVLLRFSLKECVYKAMHPLICQWVGFQEAEITPHDDGTATIKLNLKSGAQTQFQHVKAHWRRIGGDYFLTSSSVILKK